MYKMYSYPGWRIDMKTENLPQAGQEAQIDKKIHFIWVGHIMPQKNIQVVSEWAEKNPGYETIVWVDKKIAPAKELDLFIQDMKSKGITVKDINEEGVCRDSIRHELDQESPNYGMASDMLRLNILAAEGGVYLDSDILCSTPFPDEIHAPFGFLLSPWSQGTNNTLCNDIILCRKGNQIIRQLADAIEQSYIARDSFEFTHEYASMKETKGERIAKTLGVTGPGFLFHQLKKMEILNDKSEMEAIHWELQDQRYLIDRSVEAPDYFYVPQNNKNDASWVPSIKRPGIENMSFQERLENAVQLIAFDIQKTGLFNLDHYANELKVKQNSWCIAAETPSELKPDSYLLIRPRDKTGEWALYYVDEDKKLNPVTLPVIKGAIKLSEFSDPLRKFHKVLSQVSDPVNPTAQELKQIGRALMDLEPRQNEWRCKNKWPGVEEIAQELWQRVTSNDTLRAQIKQCSTQLESLKPRVAELSLTRASGAETEVEAHESNVKEQEVILQNTVVEEGTQEKNSAQLVSENSSDEKIKTAHDLIDEIIQDVIQLDGKLGLLGGNTRQLENGKVINIPNGAAMIFDDYKKYKQGELTAESALESMIKIAKLSNKLNRHTFFNQRQPETGQFYKKVAAIDLQTTIAAGYDNNHGLII
ncbi:TPA: teichoic acid biosynthesis protein [Legionella pneumophila subsp. pneumophila]|nr:Dot/Icm T4SS effector SetA [Legionella pneumophila]RYW82742.1 teichoic acid biosynthesis protein [Legionella pneumophila]RYW85602.1 teichoic acid biosynthesis protein [Legionella pneumophila]HAT2039610.1 teichoic acid biosynthesis protein [Legionella pneumophila]HAT8939689.1 teichoic acid biosynthesis protein [Legionella pneumophila subsp. pneumophila]HAT9031817.1 teichoic acid biosynthesis protein [Legionella pneumophila subsp. pneumophila]